MFLRTPWHPGLECYFLLVQHVSWKTLCHHLALMWILHAHTSVERLWIFGGCLVHEPYAVVNPSYCLSPCSMHRVLILPYRRLFSVFLLLSTPSLVPINVFALNSAHHLFTTQRSHLDWLAGNVESLMAVCPWPSCERWMCVLTRMIFGFLDDVYEPMLTWVCPCSSSSSGRLSRTRSVPRWASVTRTSSLHPSPPGQSFTRVSSPLRRCASTSSSTIFY